MLQKNDEEIWKDMPGYEGLYQVSNLGRVKSLDRTIIIKNKFSKYKRHYEEKIMKLRTNKNGYVYVTLHNSEGEIKTIQVHRLVASVFISNALNLTEINHKDENKQNNCVNNLEWCSSLYNKKYGTRNIRAGMAHRKKVIQYTKENMFVKEYASGLEAEKITKIDNASISRCCYNKQETAGGYKWRFSNE